MAEPATPPSDQPISYRNEEEEDYDPTLERRKKMAWGFLVVMIILLVICGLRRDDHGLHQLRAQP